MFFGLCLWATTVVINSMASIAGQEGWFKTEHPNPPIVSFAKDQMFTEEVIIPAKNIASTYAETLANYKENPNNSLLGSNTSTPSFLVSKAHQHRASGGEDGVIVHNTHKQTGISYITFLVGDWSGLKNRLDEILLQYHTRYQSVFPTAPVPQVQSTQSVRAASTKSVQSSLPTQGINMLVTELCAIPLNQIPENWNKSDPHFRMEIVLDALCCWWRPWQDEQTQKPALDQLFHQFFTDLPENSVKSRDSDDRQMSRVDFVEACISDLHRFRSVSRLPIAMPMFLMKHWDLLQPAQQEQEGEQYRFRRRDFRGDLVVAILTFGQRDDLGRLKDLYITPLLQGVYGKISDISLEVLFDVYQNFTHEVEVVERYFNSSAINRGHLSALQRSFMDLLPRCTDRMEQKMDRDWKTPWGEASRIAGMQANRQFLQQYKKECDMREFTCSLPLSLASEVWTDLPEENRAELFCRAAESDENLAFVRLYRDDQSIDGFTKKFAFNKASQKKYSYGREEQPQNATQAPQIAALLAEWENYQF